MSRSDTCNTRLAPEPWSMCSGKTSILFHYAYRLAAGDRSVLFICQKAKIEQLPPLLPPGVDGQDTAFSRIQ